MAQELGKVVIRYTRQQALELGLLVCECGHAPNTHFKHGQQACAICECKCYREKARGGGELLKELPLAP